MMSWRSREVVMSEDHKEILETRMRVLADNMDQITQLMNFMQQERTIRQDDRNRVRNAGLREEQIECLINILLRKPDSAFESFRAALCDTNQEHLAELLDSPGPPVEPRPQRSALPMTPHHKGKLKRHSDPIACNMEPSRILNNLLAIGSLTMGDVDRIKGYVTTNEKNEQLLKILATKADRAFYDFIDSLVEDGQHHIANLITEKAPTKAPGERRVSTGPVRSAPVGPEEEARMRETLLGPGMQQIYEEVCMEGTKKTYRIRVMLVGPFGVGKTSVKRSLMQEPFQEEHYTTDGVEIRDQTLVVNVETAKNWERVRYDHLNDMKVEVARHLRKQYSTPESSMRRQRLYDYGDEPSASGVASKHVPLPARTPNRRTRLSSEPTKLIQKMNDLRLDVVKKTPRVDQEGVDELFDIWDFGGQHIYYTSHQTFLSQRAVYLLVMDISLDLDTVLEAPEGPRMWKDTGAPKTPRDFLDFWLNSVHSHLKRGREAEETLSPPVIIVCTHTDKLDTDLEVENYILAIHEHLRGKPYYQHVHNIVPVSNLQGHGIPKLRESIENIAREQPYWGEKRPIKWLLLADKLYEDRTKDPQHPAMSYEAMLKMAEEWGVPRDEVRAFLRFHHQLGDLVHFEDEGLNDTIVLSPQWLADQFSTVITQEQIHVARQGNLSRDHVTDLKKGTFFKKTAVQLFGDKLADTIMKMMEKFDMLVPCPINNEDATSSVMYLVPPMLERSTMQSTQEKDSMPRIHFKFSSKIQQESAKGGNPMGGFLPHGIYHRLVASCCRTRKWHFFESMIFYDYMLFVADEFHFSLSMAYNGITLSAFDFTAGFTARMLAEIREHIEELLKQITDQFFPNLRCVTYLQCKCSEEFSKQTERKLPYMYAARHALLYEPGFLLATDYRDHVRKRPCPHHKLLVDPRPWAEWFALDTSAALDTTRLSRDGMKLWDEIRPHMDTLMGALPYKVIDKLIQINLLLTKERDDVNAEKTPYEKNRKMYQALVNTAGRKRDEVKKAICEGLCESSQCCPFAKEPKRRKPVSDAQHAEIDRQRVRLVEEMEVKPVADHLRQAGILDRHMQDSINEAKNRRERVDILLSFIDRTYSAAHDTFLTVLHDVNGWIFISDDLMTESSF